jgi:hypothetical protein
VIEPLKAPRASTLQFFVDVELNVTVSPAPGTEAPPSQLEVALQAAFAAADQTLAAI